MPITDCHADYTEYLPIWTKVRDCLSEEDIKAKGTTYLPKLSGQKQTHTTEEAGLSYEQYTERATFYEALGGTIDGMLGMLFRQHPIITGIPESLSSLLKNITATGVPLESYLRETLREQLLVGRVAVLLEGPNTTDAQPYLTMYRAEKIMDWHDVVRNGAKRLIQVRLREYDTQIQSDGYGVETIELIRVLELVPEGGSLVYQQRLFRQIEISGKEEYIQVERDQESGQFISTNKPIIPTRRRERLTWIPLQILNVTHLRPLVERPLLLSMANTSLAHYRTAADYRHLMHWSAIVQPWIATLARDETLYFGSPYAWMLNPGDQVGMLETSGNALGALESAMARDEERMAKQGARLLDDAKAGVEAAETLRLRQTASTSALAVLAQTASLGFTQLLRWMVWWAGVADTPDDTAVSIKINDEFIDARMTPQDYLALVTSWQARGMSRDTLLYNAKRGGVLPDDRTIEDEQALIDSEVPVPASGEEEAL